MSPQISTNGKSTPNGDASLPHLPIPPLDDTLRRYLRALEALQDPREHEATKRAVEKFKAEDGPELHEKLIAYAKDKARYVGLLVTGCLTLSSRVAGCSDRGLLARYQLHRRVLVRP